MKQKTVILAALFLSTGASLLVFIFSGISMLYTLIGILILAFIVGGMIWRKLPPEKRAELKRLIGYGTIAGFLATCLYDLSRFLLIKVTGIQFWPFDIFGIFGKALVGAQATGLWVSILGAVFHIANGTAFGVAYTASFGRRGIPGGLIWAMILELAMVTVYPGWLDLKALDELISVSVVGHFVYGIVLGYTARKLIVRRESARHVSA
ncbi:hypothetical protein KZ483_24720 [Paenibacillus sp. sptzw28]|uniref:hypothetical protein n=1 Tax=Paenibacillus sp. sptzw28 TaxID=715179 RepID=UPI001C6E4C7C|nr:hypothetical protein [Paenibacillus sp. sptzw28]QYR20919.1 hypothetical protein KZ483_24720 [Paenibacillus sp. sptzw28]